MPDRSGEAHLFEPARDQDRPDVRGASEDLGRRPVLVDPVHVVVEVRDRERCAGVPIAHRERRRHEEHRARSDHARVERSRKDDGLEGRSGLVDIDLPAHLSALQGAGREAAVRQRRSRGQRDRAAGLRVEHHGRCAFGVPLIDSLLQHPADHIVEPLVEREANVVPRDGWRGLDGARDLARALEGQRRLDAVLRAQVPVEAQLGPVLRALAVDEADDLADGGSVRIDALQRLCDEADQASLDERAEQGVGRDAVAGARVEVACDDRPLVGGAVDLLAHVADRRLGHDPRDRLRDRVDAVDVRAVDRQLVGLDRERERLAVAIRDRPARRPQRALLALLRERLLRVGGVVEHLQLQRARGQQAEEQRDACEEQADAPVRAARQRRLALLTGHAGAARSR